MYAASNCFCENSPTVKINYKGQLQDSQENSLSSEIIRISLPTSECVISSNSRQSQNDSAHMAFQHRKQ